MLSNKKSRDALILAGLAGLYVIAAWFVSSGAGLFRGDPDYAYLLNGLSILTFRTPDYFDHPGTPVEEIIALVSGVAWLLTLPGHAFSNIRGEILANPEFYLTCVSWVFTVIVAAAIFFFAWSVRGASGMLAPGIIGGISIFCSQAAYLSFHRAAPEPLLLAIALVLAGLVARRAWDAQRQETLRYAAVFGLMLGLSVTAKVTSAPVLLAIFFLRSGKARKTAALMAALSAAVFLLPIAPHARVMLRSYYNILTHKGVYGSGASGTLSLSEYAGNILFLAKFVPEIFISLALFLVVLAGARILRRPLPENLSRALWISAGIIILSILLVAKQPQPYYLMPSLGFAALGNAILAFLLLRRPGFPKAAALAIIALLAVLAIRKQYLFTQATAADWTADRALLQQAAQSGCLVIPYYAVQSTLYNLSFGNDMAGDFYGDALAKQHPGTVLYHTGRKEFETFAGPLSRREIAALFSRQKCVYLIGNPWTRDFGLPPSALRLVAQSRGGATLYALQPGF